MLRARDIMTPNPVSVRPNTTVVEVARLMSKFGIGSVLIIDENGKLVGIVTSRDIVNKVVAKGLDPKNTYARDIMSSPVIYASPNTLVKELAELMSKNNIHHVPIVEGQRVVGIVAEHDILTYAPEMIEALEILYTGVRRRGSRFRSVYEQE